MSKRNLTSSTVANVAKKAKKLPGPRAFCRSSQHFFFLFLKFHFLLFFGCSKMGRVPHWWWSNRCQRPSVVCQVVRRKTAETTGQWSVAIRRLQGFWAHTNAQRSMLCDWTNSKWLWLMLAFFPGRSSKAVLLAGVTFDQSHQAFVMVRNSLNNTWSLTFSAVIFFLCFLRFLSPLVRADVPDKLLCLPEYDATINKHKVTCGGSLGTWEMFVFGCCSPIAFPAMWESKGWVSPQDPYGWFQWYCRFYQGRRSNDDARQIGRWQRVSQPDTALVSTNCPVLRCDRSMATQLDQQSGQSQYNLWWCVCIAGCATNVTNVKAEIASHKPF